MAAAAINVPASMRSGMTVNSAPCSSFLPLMTSVLVPAPLTQAPLAFRNCARSTTSGSCGANSAMPFRNEGVINNVQARSKFNEWLGSHPSYICEYSNAFRHCCCHHQGFCCANTGIIEVESTPNKSFAICCTHANFPITVVCVES